MIPCRLSRALVAAFVLLVVLVAADAGTALAAASDTGVQPPATIKVARRWPANDPQGRIYRVDTVDFRTYCAKVLSHEWAPPTSFSDEALRAGALAVREYAWYWTMRPTKLADVRAAGADVDDSVNYQVYMDWDYGQRYYDAVDAVWSTGFTRNGEIFQASYYAGSYNGSQTDGYHMTQWGSEYWADKGYTYEQILRFYYDDVELTADAVPDGSEAVAGAPDLQVVGPVLFADTQHDVGDRLRFEFTLTNKGGEATWNSVRLALRGPGDEVRDAGQAGPLTLATGDFRMFTASARLDLPGRWQGWLLAETTDGLVLVGDGAPFTFLVKGEAPPAAEAATGASEPAAAATGEDPLSQPRTGGALSLFGAR